LRDNSPLAIEFQISIFFFFDREKKEQGDLLENSIFDKTQHRRKPTCQTDFISPSKNAPSTYFPQCPANSGLSEPNCRAAKLRKPQGVEVRR